MYFPLLCTKFLSFSSSTQQSIVNKLLLLHFPINFSADLLSVLCEVTCLSWAKKDFNRRNLLEAVILRHLEIIIIVLILKHKGCK